MFAKAEVSDKKTCPAITDRVPYWLLAKGRNVKPIIMKLRDFLPPHVTSWGTAVAQWLRCCATNREVADSMPMVSLEFFIDIKSFRSHYDPGVDSASNRNEYQEYFLGVKAAGG